MVKNNLGDMHNLLMEQLQSLVESDGDEAKIQIEKAKAASQLGATIVDNARAVAQFTILQERVITPLPKMLGASGE